MGDIRGITFEIGARLTGDFNAAFANAGSKIKGLGAQAKELSSMQNKMRKLTAAQNNLAELKDRQRLNPGLDLSKDIGRAEKAFKNARASVDRLSESFKKNGIDAKDLGRAQEQLAKRVSQVKAAANRQRILQNMDTARGKLRTGMFNVGLAGAAMTVPVKLAIDYETSLSEVKKVTDLTEQEFKGLADDLLKTSTEIPMAVTDLTDIAAAAGRSGIAKTREELAAFAKDAAVMGVAFDMSGMEAGDAMTALRNNFHLNRDEMTKLGDAMNTLANNMFVSGSELVDFSVRAGGTATTLGMNGQQVAAAGAALRDAGVDAESGSRAFSIMLTRLNNADIMGKKVQAAFGDIGLSGKEMSRLMKEDAQKGVLTFIDAVRKSKDPLKALSVIIGNEHAPKIAKLVQNYDKYVEALRIANDETMTAGSMQNEYAVKSKTTANAIQLAKNATHEFAVVVGQHALPQVASLAEKIASVTKRFTEFAQANPDFVNSFLNIGGGALGVTGGLMVLGYGLSFVVTGLVRLYEAFKLVGTGIKLIATNPLVAGFLLLATAVYYLYTNLDACSKKYDEFFSKKNAYDVFNGPGYKDEENYPDLVFDKKKKQWVKRADNPELAAQADKEKEEQKTAQAVAHSANLVQATPDADERAAKQAPAAAQPQQPGVIPPETFNPAQMSPEQAKAYVAQYERDMQEAMSGAGGEAQQQAPPSPSPAPAPAAQPQFPMPAFDTNAFAGMSFGDQQKYLAQQSAQQDAYFRAANIQMPTVPAVPAAPVPAPAAQPAPQAQAKPELDIAALLKEMPPAETKVEAPVNQVFNVTQNGILPGDFDTNVIKAIKERGQADLAKFFADLITRAVAADRRASFAG